MKKAPWCVDMNVCMHEEDGLIRETAPGLPSKVTLCQRLEYILRLWYDKKWQVQWQIFFSTFSQAKWTKNDMMKAARRFNGLIVYTTVFGQTVALINI